MPTQFSPLGRAARSGRPERRTRGCDCEWQDRGVTPVGLRSVPVGWSGWIDINDRHPINGGRRREGVSPIRRPW